MKDEQVKARPIAEVRVASIRAAIWKNGGKNGPWFTITVDRTYRGDDNQFHSTTAFGRDDLLALAKCVDLAHTKILELQAEAESEENGI